VRLWDLAAHREVRQFAASDNLNAVRFSADGQRVIAGGSDGSLEIWRVADGARLTTLAGHDFGVTGLDVGHDNGLAVTASIDETVQLWDLRRGEPALTLYGHEGPVLSVALSPDSHLVASGGLDGTVRVWRRGDGDRLRVYDRHGGPVWSVAFTPDGEHLLSGGADGLVVTHDLRRDAPAPATAGAQTAAAPAAVAATAEHSRGAVLFKKCVACHTVTADGAHRAGPSLHGLFGRTAGSRSDYPYSSALRSSTLVWTEATVDRLFEIGPENLVPGSKMPLQRMPSAEDRALLVDYLKQITAPR
jgi:cytochrome c